MNLSDKVIMVTGAGAGIGAAAAKVLAGYGAKVVCVGLTFEKLAKVANEIAANGGEAIAIRADVSNRDTVRTVVEEAVERFGKIDGLLNNAGICISKRIDDISDEELMLMFNTNVMGYFIVATEVARAMKQAKKGRIVNVSSIAGLQNEVSNGAYGMSKAAITMLTQAIALEWAEYGITAVTISPGFIDTEMNRKAIRERSKAQGLSSEEYVENMLTRITIGRFGQPSEVAELAAYLFDDRSSFMDGNNIIIAGGRVMR